MCETGYELMRDRRVWPWQSKPYQKASAAAEEDTDTRLKVEVHLLVEDGIGSLVTLPQAEGTRHKSLFVKSMSQIVANLLSEFIVAR